MGRDDEVCCRFAGGSRAGDRRCFDIVGRVEHYIIRDDMKCTRDFSMHIRRGRPRVVVVTSCTERGICVVQPVLYQHEAMYSQLLF